MTLYPLSISVSELILGSELKEWNLLTDSDTSPKSITSPNIKAWTTFTLLAWPRC